MLQQSCLSNHCCLKFCFAKEQGDVKFGQVDQPKKSGKKLSEQVWENIHSCQGLSREKTLYLMRKSGKSFTIIL